MFILEIKKKISGILAINKFHILPTKDTPEIIFKPDGFIRIGGRGLMGPNVEISEQILVWIHKYLENPPEITTIIVAMEYLNSFSAKILVSILKEISFVIKQNKQYFIHWFYEEDDEDILERGEYISSTLNIPIDFIRTKSIKDCCKSIC